MASQRSCRAVQVLMSNQLLLHTIRWQRVQQCKLHILVHRLVQTRQLSVSARALRRPPEHAGATPIGYDGTSPSSILKPERSSSTTSPTATPPGEDGSSSSGIGEQPAQEAPSLRHRIAEKMAKIMPSSTIATYQAYVRAEMLYKECKSQAEHPEGEEYSAQAKFWYEDCGLPETFNTWVQITTLYMWTITVRLRCLEKEHAAIWQQHFVNHFFYDMEKIMVDKYKINSGSQRSKYLKEINEQFRGSIGAYDEGLFRGDAELATALWRNIWDASDEVDFEKMALVVSFVRRIIAALEKVDDARLLGGQMMFGSPTEESATLKRLVEEKANVDENN